MTTFNSSSGPPVDPWEQPTGTERNVRKAVARSAVKDDWEDEDDEDEKANEGDGPVPMPTSLSSARSGAVNDEDPRKVWEAANTEVAVPMPTLLPSRSGSVVPPPAAAFQPSLRILKRPQSSSPSQGTPTTSPPPSGESIQQREARYAAARERIFGTESPGNEDGNKTLPNVKVIREPRAPESTPGTRGQSAGFRGRGAKAPPSTRPAATS